MDKDGPFYTITYKDRHSPDEIRTTLISAPHTVDRIKEILAEVHPEWDIISIILSPHRQTLNL